MTDYHTCPECDNEIGIPSMYRYEVGEYLMVWCRRYEHHERSVARVMDSPGGDGS